MDVSFHIQIDYPQPVCQGSGMCWSSQLSSQVLETADVLVGLHACGGLSDLILANACVHGAAFAVVTCCFRSHRSMRVPALAGTRANRRARKKRFARSLLLRVSTCLVTLPALPSHTMPSLGGFSIAQLHA